LFANLRGTVSGKAITFTKTYDGTGGVSHSVFYQGTISSDGRSMSGRWNIGTFGGTFSAVATSRAPAQTSCLEPGQIRTTDNFVYWNFLNRCDHDVYVSVCANFGNGTHPIYGTNVPARRSADIPLGASSLGPANLKWAEGGSITCP